MITLTDIAQAVRDQDSVMEETSDVPAFTERLGVDLVGLMRVAEQRALRSAMQRDGLPPVAWGERPRAILLSDASRELIPTFVALWVDAFCAGIQCEKRTG